MSKLKKIAGTAVIDDRDQVADPVGRPSRSKMRQDRVSRPSGRTFDHFNSSLDYGGGGIIIQCGNRLIVSYRVERTGCATG